jgi:hypothetical protein
MRTRIGLISVLVLALMLNVAQAQEPKLVYLPFIIKSGSGGTRMPYAVLKITDGTLEVNLIKPPLGLGYHLEDWRPSIPDYKRGGTWQDSPLAMGRRLSQKQFENAIETFRLKANEADQDQMIRELQDLLRPGRPTRPTCGMR